MDYQKFSRESNQVTQARRRDEINALIKEEQQRE